MRVRSKLADIEFQIGSVERKENELIIRSHPDQAMKTRVHISPEDVIIALKILLGSGAVWGYLLRFPYFYLRARRGNTAVKTGI